MNEELGLVGIVLPPVIDLLNSYIVDSRIRFLISFAICALLGAALAGFSSWSTVVHMTTIVFATAQATYNLGWKESDIRQVMKSTITKL